MWVMTFGLTVDGTDSASLIYVATGLLSGARPRSKHPLIFLSTVASPCLSGHRFLKTTPNWRQPTSGLDKRCKSGLCALLETASLVRYIKEC
ncbi:unnamed protein product [Mycena citricolor]|uniref:Uncharacterized protein n=1 Tax=Mycena citricolor TaxID=2018698 RepID=A0AAD2HQ73_9AGAR|nr:unnamed protein product [Mycena citricolor]